MSEYLRIRLAQTGCISAVLHPSGRLIADSSQPDLFYNDTKEDDHLIRGGRKLKRSTLFFGIVLLFSMTLTTAHIYTTASDLPPQHDPHISIFTNLG